MPQGDDTESSLVRYSALLRESWLSFQVCNNAQRIYDIWSSSHRTCNAQVVQVNSREEFGILHIKYSHRVSRGTTIQSYAAPSSSPILFVSYTKPVLEVLSLFLIIWFEIHWRDLRIFASALSFYIHFTPSLKGVSHFRNLSKLYIVCKDGKYIWNQYTQNNEYAYCITYHCCPVKVPDDYYKV